MGIFLKNEYCHQKHFILKSIRLYLWNVIPNIYCEVFMHDYLALNKMCIIIVECIKSLETDIKNINFPQK